MKSMLDTPRYQSTNPITMPRGLRDAAGTFPASAGERRVVTILFCDVAGSTAMAELLDPEEWAELMNEAFDHLIRPIERYDGTVTRLMGDAVLALFGAPQAHADDPQRAILAAMEIIRGINELSERLKRQRGLDFNVRIGINTGLVVVGTFGSQDLVEYTAMGDAINVAARIQQLAEPGTIRVGETTHRLTERFFDFEALGADSVRGKREPERTYRVIDAKAQSGRFVDRSRREMPFTGRDREMEKLREVVDDLRFNGRGRIVAIPGEAGVGKSRLVSEFLRYVKALPEGDGGLSIAILENQISPYDVSRPYAGLQARFRKVFGIEPDDPPPVVREKFIERTNQFPPEFRERAARVIQRVMALDLDGGYDGEFERDEFRSELRQVVLQIVSGWNPGGAFMLVGEDYHWGDAASLQIVADLYELVENQPVIFLCTFRPELDSPVMRVFQSVRERYSEHMLVLRLDPLEPADTQHLVQSLVDGDAEAADGLRRVIQERSEGNPLFIEEILNALSEQGAIEPSGSDAHYWQPASHADLSELSIPSSIQALLLERIDRLPPDARRTLQQAAVLGRTFSRQILREIAEINGALDSHLDELMRAGLVRQVDDNSKDSLAFRHALIQDAAYETILHRHRREFHRRAAETMESLYADRQSEFAGAIGCHYYQAEDTRGIGWLIQAAEQAQSVYEPETTIDYTSKAIEFASRIGAKPPVAAYHLRGHAQDVLGDYCAARADLETVLEISRNANDPHQEWDALIDIGALWAESDYSRAGPCYESALELARTLGDEYKIAHSLNRVGNWRINTGDPKDARAAHQQALDIFERLGDANGLAETLDLVGLASYLSADFVASARYFRQAIDMFRASGNDRNLASSLSLLALSGGGLDQETSPAAEGQQDEWLDHACESLSIARKIGWRAGEAFALVVAGAAKADHGQPGDGIRELEQARAFAAKIGHHQWSVAAAANLGITLANVLDWEEAKTLLLEGLSMARDLGSEYWTRTATSHLVTVYIDTGELDAANDLLSRAFSVDDTLDSLGQRKLWFSAANLAIARGESQKALEIADCLLETAPGKGPDSVIPDLALLRGRALIAAGDPHAAILDLAVACEHTAARQDTSLLWRLQIALATAARESGDSETAQNTFSQAEGTIDSVAGQLDNARSQVFQERARERLQLARTSNLTPNR